MTVPPVSQSWHMWRLSGQCLVPRKHSMCVLTTRETERQWARERESGETLNAVHLFPLNVFPPAVPNTAPGSCVFNWHPPWEFQCCVFAVCKLVAQPCFLTGDVWNVFLFGSWHLTEGQFLVFLCFICSKRFLTHLWSSLFQSHSWVLMQISLQYLSKPWEILLRPWGPEGQVAFRT